MFRFPLARLLHTARPPIQVAVVGSGPSAFYTVLHLLQKQDPKVSLNIDIFEKLPVPFGLSRYGVAPDHPEVKNCEEKFTEIMEKTSEINHKGPISSTVNFYGNTEIGKQIPLKALKRNYNIVLLAYGCAHEKKLGIPGANLPGVISSRKFVGWYNGLPELQTLDPPLEKAQDVIIIGNGNVALDIARVLLTPPSFWKSTDISTTALEKLKKSSVKRVRIVARRGFLQSAFTNKELRELLNLSKRNVFLEPLEPNVLKPVQLVRNHLSRINKRKLELIEKYFKTSKDITPDAKTWSLEFLKLPVEIFSGSDSSLLLSTKFQLNRLQEDLALDKDDTTQKNVKVVPTDQVVSEKSELVITSIGYQGLSLASMEDINILFDTRRGVVPNERSRVLDKNGNIIPGFYATGWILYGPTGVIASTMMNSFATALEILHDMPSLEPEVKEGAKALKLDNATTWSDWKKIDQFETAQGGRRKVLDVEEMLKIVNKA